MLLSGCEHVGVAGPKGGSYPAACAEFGFPARRCAAIVDRAIDEAPINKTLVAGIELLPPAPPALREGQHRSGGPMVVQVRFSFANAPSVTQEVWCHGIDLDDDLACTKDPRLMLFAGIDHDVPCAGEPPAGCATLPKTPDHAAMDAANPLRIVALDIPLDHLGRYEVKVGRASLPNGYLSRREFDLTDLKPTTFWITGGIRLDVRSTVAGRPPIGSVYRDGFKGPEPVDVFLVFDVTGTSPGAVLRVRELIVQ
jgi:hypothetical protein